MQTMAAPSLADKNIVRSVRQPKLTVKAALCSPFNVLWPPLTKDTEENILDKLVKTFTAVDLKKPPVPKNVPKEKKKEMMMERWNERTDEQKNLRSQLTIGLGSTTRFLENDHLQLVIVDRSTPSLLHRHLVQLAAVRQCPAVAVSGLSRTLAPLLGMQSLVALGFKKLSVSDSSHFSQLVSAITQDAPTISLPWADFEAAIVNSDDESETEDPPSKEINKPANKKSNSVPDYSHLYIYKRDVHISEKEDNFIALGSDDSDSSPCPVSSVGASQKRKMSKQSQTQKAKRLKAEKGRQQVSNYVEGNVVQIYSNVNKQKKVKRKKVKL